MVLLALRMIPALRPPGAGEGERRYLHVQTNPRYRTAEKLVANGVRLSHLFRELRTEEAAGVGPEPRLCVKIPCDYPGMLAAGRLKGTYGVACLATIGVAVEQVRLAHGVGGCEFVAVYVNELGVHFGGWRGRGRG